MNKAFRNAIRDVFNDGGLIIFFLLVPLIYPLLYTFIYTNETVHEVPVAVVDADGSSMSREFLRRLDASPDVKIVSHERSLEEARTRVKHREAYGVVCIAEDFTRNIMRMEQAHVNLYCDMSGMLYYKAILSSATDVSLGMNADIKVSRAGNTTDREDEVTVQPLHYEQTALFNPQNGFAAFLIPAVLMIVIQQTLLLGVGMEAGTRRERMESTRQFPQTEEFTLDDRAMIETIGNEENGFAKKKHPRAPQPRHASRRALRTLLGRSTAFLTIYVPIAVFEMGVVPHLFDLPQIGNAWEILAFSLPYLLACILFAITLSVLPRNRESVILLVVFSSVPILFLSGVSWPGSAFPWYWKTLSYLIPSTFGVNGFVRLNTMGADLSAVRFEYFALWTQVLLYGLTAWWVTRKNELYKIDLKRFYRRWSKTRNKAS